MDFPEPTCGFRDKTKKDISQFENDIPASNRRKPAPAGLAQTQTPEFQRWSGGAPLVLGKDSPTYAFKTGQPIVVESYHGAGRPDRVGTVFNLALTNAKTACRP